MEKKTKLKISGIAKKSIQNIEKAKIRRDWVITRMLEERFLTEEEAEIAIEKPITIQEDLPEDKEIAGFFSDSVKKELTNLYGSDNVFESGIVVHTTLNKRMQDISISALQTGIEDYDMRHGYRGKITTIKINDDWKENGPWGLHIHTPEAATPKDGPSAGIAMVTSIVSSITNIPVNKEIAMTGEVTVTGQVLAIGGLKEKLLAAHRAGIKQVLIPKENEKDLVDMPKKIIDEIKITPVEYADEVLKIALTKELKKTEWVEVDISKKDDKSQASIQ